LAVYLNGMSGTPVGWRVRLQPGSWMLVVEGGRPKLVVAEPSAGLFRLEVDARSIVAVPGTAAPTLNGAPLDGPHPLRPGDQLAVGALVLRLEVQAASTEAPAAAPGVALPPPDPPRWRSLLRLLAVAAVAAAAVATWQLIPKRAATPEKQFSPEVRRAVEAAAVWVREPDKSTEGSGVVVGSGWIITNAHVLDGGTHPTVTFHAGTPASATVSAQAVRVGTPESDRDIALLRADTSGVTPLRLADLANDPAGTVVAAFGFPLGSDLSLSPQGPNIDVRGGHITALRQQDGHVAFVEGDFAIEVGNSGGPVVDTEGRVVGLATMIAGPNLRVALCVSADMIRGFAPEVAGQ
jgi:S1-C subfamily serine protease